METLGLDADTLTMVTAALLTAGGLAGVVHSLRASPRRLGRAVASAVVVLLAAAVLIFFATFQIRLF